MTSRRALLVVVTLAFAGPAGAPPPLSPFPDEIVPSGGSAPPNARVWAFGRDAPAPDAVGFAVTASGTPVEGSVDPLAGDALRFTPTSALPDGPVSVALTSPGGELQASFTVEGDADVAPPMLGDTVVLDEGPPLVLGVTATDDRVVAGVLARHGDVVVAAAPLSAVLVTPLDEDGCVSVTAVDAAGHESAPRQVCGPAPEPEPEPAAEPEPSPEPEPADDDDGGGGCAAAPGAPPGALALVLLASRRRR